MNRLALALLTSLGLGALALAIAGPGAVVPPPLPTAHQVERLEPTPELGVIASAVGTTLMTGHYAEGILDDARSAAWLKAYLEGLDPQKLYFLASDVEGFTSAWSAKLDNDLLSAEPKLSAAYEIHARFRERVSERVASVQQMLAGPLPLDGSAGRVDLDREPDPWAKDAAELDLVWRARLTEQVLTMTLGEGEEGEAAVPLTPIERLKKRYDRIRKDVYDVDAEDVLEAYLAALSSTYDPHSVWFKPVSKENFDIDMQDTLIGIGAVLGNEDGYTVVRELVTGGPAAKSGLLKPKDTILAVAQGDQPSVDVVDMKIERVVQLIRGREGSEVVLTVHPAEASDPAETKPVRLVREKVKLSEASAKGEIREVNDGGKRSRIGVINVPSFYVDSDGQAAGDPNYGSTARDVAKIIRGWSAEGVDSLLIDLRENGGGSLDQALQLTGLFLEGGPVVQIRSRRGEVEVLNDPDPKAMWTGPVVVLTSEFAASASEIFAAALQDHGRALVVGSGTHGKGTVQNLVGLERYLTRIGQPLAAARAGALKFTTHMFFRVNGESTQIRGVSPAVQIPSPYEGLKVKESDLDGPLAWDKINPAKYRARDLGVDLAALQAASRARVAAAPEFIRMAEDVTERRQNETLGSLSLDLEERKAEFEALKAKEAAREVARKAEGWDGEAKIDPVLEEALRVARDFVAARR